MAYSATQIESFRSELTDLRVALTKLRTGKMTVNVVIDGDVVQYHRIDIPDLKGRIGELEAILLSVDSPSEYVTSIHIRSSKGL